MSLIPEGINRYAEFFSTPENQVLTRLTRETHIKTERGEMLSGHLQGMFLQMLSASIQPSAILEIGTFTGYSAFCLAKGVKKDGILYTVDIDDELQDMAQKYWEQGGIGHKIKCLAGKAMDVLPTIDMQFDIIFIDADKSNYSSYYEMALERLAPNGVILIDNVLYGGEVMMPPEFQSKNAKAIQELNIKIKNDYRVEHVLLPIRDGIMMVRKL